MSNRSFINTFLDSPIMVNDRDKELCAFIRWKEGDRKGFLKQQMTRFSKWESMCKDYEVEALEPMYYEGVVENLPKDILQKPLRDSLRLSDTMTNLALAGLRNWGMELVQSWTSPKYEDLPEWGTHALERLTFLREYVDAVASDRATGRARFTSIHKESWTLAGDEYVCMLSESVSKLSYIASFEQILMIKDMLWARANVAIACSVLYPRSQLSGDIGDCLQWCTSCVTTYGNEGYGLLKQIEPLTKTAIIALADPILGDTLTNPRMIEEVRSKERKLSGNDTPLVDRLLEILARPRGLPEAVELFGLQKLSGHPCIDPVLGGQTVRNTACKEKHYSISNVSRIRNNFCRMYSEGYIRKEGRWPKMVFPEGTRHTRLYQLFSRQETKIHRHSYPIEDWEGVRFLKHHDFEYYPNFTDLMDDRSISYYRDQVSCTWDKKVIPRSNKRLLLEMLSREDFSVRKIAEVFRSGLIPFSWLIVSLYPKEREFKIASRMFAMMTIEARTFFTALEANWADNIFPYLPAQTMTLSKQEVTELFHSMTTGARSGDYEKVYAEFDIEKWNSEFRAELYDPIARDAEDMHGEPNLFTVIHHFFEQCVMMVRVASLEPDHVKMAEIPGVDMTEYQSGLMWVHHGAGVEGISQKPWSGATYSGFDLGMSDFPFSY